MQIPEDFLTLENSDTGTAKAESKFTSEFSAGTLTKDQDVTADAYAKKKKSFMVLCTTFDRTNQKIFMWSEYNQQISTENSPKSV